MRTVENRAVAAAKKPPLAEAIAALRKANQMMYANVVRAEAHGAHFERQAGVTGQELMDFGALLRDMLEEAHCYQECAYSQCCAVEGALNCIASGPYGKDEDLRAAHSLSSAHSKLACESIAATRLHQSRLSEALLAKIVEE